MPNSPPPSFFNILPNNFFEFFIDLLCFLQLIEHDLHGIQYVLVNVWYQLRPLHIIESLTMDDLKQTSQTNSSPP